MTFFSQFGNEAGNADETGPNLCSLPRDSDRSLLSEPRVGSFVLINNGDRKSLRIESASAQAEEKPAMLRHAKVGILIVLLGLFLPIFFRVGWETLETSESSDWVPVRTRTGTIVLREAKEGVISEAEKEAILAKKYDTAWGGVDALISTKKRNATSEISWPARITDVIGLCVAFAGVLTVVVGSFRRKPLE